MKVTFEDQCPACGEMSLHTEDEDTGSYSVRCSDCRFQGNWKSIDDFIDWEETNGVKKDKRQARKAKKEARLLNEDDY